MADVNDVEVCKIRYITNFQALFNRENARLFNCLKTDFLRIVEIYAHNLAPHKEPLREFSSIFTRVFGHIHVSFPGIFMRVFRTVSIS